MLTMGITQLVFHDKLFTSNFISDVKLNYIEAILYLMSLQLVSNNYDDHFKVSIKITTKKIFKIIN